MLARNCLVILFWFACELCDFRGASEHGLSVHMNRKHNSIPQIDGIDERQDEERLDGNVEVKKSLPSHNCSFCNFWAKP